MKSIILDILNKYLAVFPEEYERQGILSKYLESHDDNDIVNWNNFDGHIVASGFIYALEERKFLVLYHKDLNMYLYPGGHVDSSDKDTFEAAKREIKEESGLDNLKALGVNEKQLIPIDIDTHMIGYNQRLNLPEHYHFDFRYLFTIDKIEEIKADSEELSDYKWISVDELINDPNYGKITEKIERLLPGAKHKKL